MLAMSNEPPTSYRSATLFSPNILNFDRNGQWYIITKKRKKKPLHITSDPEAFKRNFTKGLEDVYLTDLATKSKVITKQLITIIAAIETELNFETTVKLLFFLLRPLELEVNIAEKEYPLYLNKDIVMPWLKLQNPSNSRILALLSSLIQIHDLIDFVNGHKADPSLEQIERSFQSYTNEFNLPKQTIEEFLDGIAEPLISRIDLRSAITEYHKNYKEQAWETSEWDKFQKLLVAEDKNTPARLELEFDLDDFGLNKVESFINEGSPEQQRVKQKNWDGFVNLCFRRLLSVGKYREFITQFPNFLSNTQDTSLATLLLATRANDTNPKAHLNSIALYILFINKSEKVDIEIPHSIHTRVTPDRTFGFFKRVIQHELILKGHPISETRISNETNRWRTFKQLLAQDRRETKRELVNKFTPQEFERAKISSFIKEGSPEQQRVKQKNWDGFLAGYFKKCLGLGKISTFIREFPKFLSRTRDVSIATLLLSVRTRGLNTERYLNSVALYIFYINNDKRAQLQLPCDLNTIVNPDKSFAYYKARIELERKQQQFQLKQVGT